MSHIFIDQVIGTEKSEISADRVLSQLNPESETIYIHFNTPGGDVYEGFRMYNGILNFKANTGKKVVGIVDSVCASIGTLVLAACDEIVMKTVSQMMIHNPHTKAEGDANKFRGIADQLDKIKHLLIGVYQKRTGLPEEKLWELYDNTTWLNASEAKQLGFADEVEDAIKAVAKINIENFMDQTKFEQLLGRFKNLIGLTKIKNEFTETLTDGRVIVVMSEDGDWVGKQVILEDGSPLEDGTFTTQSGKAITIAGGSITDVQQASPPEDNKNEEMENKVKELEAQLAEAKAALETATNQAKSSEQRAVTAEANTIKIQNRVTQIEKDFIKLKEEASKTVGDNTPPPAGPVIKNLAGTDRVQDYDPMGEEVKKFYKRRNLINED